MLAIESSSPRVDSAAACEHIRTLAMRLFGNRYGVCGDLDEYKEERSDGKPFVAVWRVRGVSSGEAPWGDGATAYAALVMLLEDLKARVKHRVVEDQRALAAVGA